MTDRVARSGLTNVGILDLSNVLVGHRLCEVGVPRRATAGDGARSSRCVVARDGVSTRTIPEVRLVD